MIKTSTKYVNHKRYTEIIIGGQRCQFYCTRSNQMNTELFQHYCRNFMNYEQGRILLITDNHASHKLDPLVHTNIRLETFVPGTTCVSQVQKIKIF